MKLGFKRLLNKSDHDLISLNFNMSLTRHKQAKSLSQVKMYNNIKKRNNQEHQKT